MSAYSKVAERIVCVDLRLGISQGLFEAGQVLVFRWEQQQIESRRALEERNLNHALVQVDGHVFAGMDGEVDVIVEQMGVQSGDKLSNMGAQVPAKRTIAPGAHWNSFCFDATGTKPLDDSVGLNASQGGSTRSHAQRHARTSLCGRCSWRSPMVSITSSSMRSSMDAESGLAVV